VLKPLVSILFILALITGVTVGHALDRTYGVEKKLPVQTEAKGKLASFSVGADGQIYAILVAPAASRARPDANADKPSGIRGEVVVLNAEGEIQRHWNTTFVPQRIAVARTGEVYVAGNGQLAQYSATGVERSVAQLPHIEQALADRAAIKELAVEQAAEQLQRMKEPLRMYEELLAKKIKQEEAAAGEKEQKQAGASPVDGKSAPKIATDEDDPEAARNSYLARLTRKQIEAMIAGLKQRITTEEHRSPEERVEAIVKQYQSSSSVHALAVTDQGLYYAARKIESYGYTLWYVKSGSTQATKVIESLGGCCGQCDCHIHDGKVYVADNTKHRVTIYDLHGQIVSHFGKADRGGEGAGFGGCCNPMNLNFGPAGEILTAESEGIVKCFTADGTFDKVLGKAPLAAGCKHVPLTLSPDAKYLYFLDLPGGNIIRLEQGTTAEPAKAKTVE